jgi:hypothetical protein
MLLLKTRAMAANDLKIVPLRRRGLWQDSVLARSDQE